MKGVFCLGGRARTRAAPPRTRELALARQAVTHKVQADPEAHVIDEAVDFACSLASTARSNQSCAVRDTN